MKSPLTSSEKIQAALYILDKLEKFSDKDILSILNIVMFSTDYRKLKRELKDGS